ncbi:MAG: cupin domain-containing protein [Bacteroides sp.]|nr:cupin domain-containing protein [Bacteroides sp.]MCM1094697.1 cupin domain-containing protein [Terasakiella sp.]
MTDVKTLNSGAGYTHATVGDIAAPQGKLFVKDATGATSCEISLGSLAPGEAVPFFHSHRANEENYIILSGAGRFQVDGDVFDIAAGSVVRVATGCDRNLKCTSSEPMTYICIQAREGSLDGYTMTDADITERESLL